MERLNRQELEELRLQIAHDCNTPAFNILLHDNGAFEMHNVREDEAQRIVSKLRQFQGKYSNVRLVNSGYDLGSISFSGANFGQPKKKFTINGNAFLNVKEDMKIENLNEGKGLDIAKKVGGAVWNTLKKWGDYLINGSEEEKAYWAKVEQDIQNYKDDRHKSDVFRDLDLDIRIQLIEGFVERYNGHQIWTDIGKEFGDEAIDLAMELDEHRFIHVLPSEEAKDQYGARMKKLF